jgi:hypothetical protein
VLDGRNPYRSSARRPSLAARRRQLPDADVVILFLVLSPLFLGVVVRAIVRGETFGAEATLCGGLLVLGLAMAIAAWRARE